MIKPWRVWLRSKPGMYAQYNGKVDVFADTADHAVDAAIQKLKNTTFPDRTRDMWVVEKVERRYD